MYTHPFAPVYALQLHACVSKPCGYTGTQDLQSWLGTRENKSADVLHPVHVAAEEALRSFQEPLQH